MDYYSFYQSPLGYMLMTSDGKSLLALDFVKDDFSTESLDKDKKNNNLPIFKDTKSWLDIYFSGEEPSFTPEIKLKGTDFRKRIWVELLQIPYGQIKSYGEISQKLFDDKGHSQAVGGAVGHNPISIIVPCHRVLGSDRSLTGYAGGLDRKKYLLDLEKISYKENSK